MAINWGLAQQPNAFERAFAEAQQSTMQQRAMQQEEAARNALASYAMKPNEAGFSALAQAAPEIAIQERQRMDARASETRIGDLRAAYMRGDVAAGQELARLDPQGFNSLSSNRRAYEGQMVTAASNLAQRILTLPPEQRAGVYQQQIAILAQRFPELAGHEYSDELMQSTIAEADDWQQFNNSQQPDIFSVQAGGSAFGRDAQGNLFPVIVPNYNGAPAGAPAGPTQGRANVPSGSPLVSSPAPQQQTRQSPIFPAAQWREYQRAVGASLPAIVERDRPVIVNSQGVQVQTDVLNGQVAYFVNGQWYDNPEGQ